jgi:hypothetical protein
MGAANASARGQRAVTIASPLHQRIGSFLTIDRPSTDCGGESTFAITNLASFYKD